MAVKEIKIYNGTSWSGQQIGMKAQNIESDNGTIFGGEHTTQGFLTKLLPSSSFNNKVIYSNNSKIAASNISKTALNTNLSNYNTSKGSIASRLNTINSTVSTRQTAIDNFGYFNYVNVIYDANAFFISSSVELEDCYIEIYDDSDGGVVYNSTTTDINSTYVTISTNYATSPRINIDFSYTPYFNASNNSDYWESDTLNGSTRVFNSFQIIKNGINKRTLQNFNYIRDMFHPIGSIYCSYTSTSPVTSFGGTWEKLPDQTFLKGQPIASVNINNNHSVTEGDMNFDTTLFNTQKGVSLHFYNMVLSNVFSPKDITSGACYHLSHDPTSYTFNFKYAWRVDTSSTNAVYYGSSDGSVSHTFSSGIDSWNIGSTITIGNTNSTLSGVRLTYNSSTNQFMLTVPNPSTIAGGAYSTIWFGIINIQYMAKTYGTNNFFLNRKYLPTLNGTIRTRKAANAKLIYRPSGPDFYAASDNVGGITDYGTASGKSVGISGDSLPGNTISSIIPGQGHPIDIRPPFLAVAMWKRTA